MNCEEYKLAIAANPAFDGGAGHLQECAECRAFRVEMQALNLKIAKALHIAAPTLVVPALPDLDSLDQDLPDLKLSEQEWSEQGLPEQDGENVVSLAARRPLPKPVWFALAATVLLAAFVGFRTLSVDTPGGSLEQQLLAHLDHERAALRTSSTPVSDLRLQRVVSAEVATMNHDAGLITYAQNCRINGNDVPHLVIQGEKGPITILLMPKEEVSEASLIDGENVQGVILQVGEGSIAIIGVRDEQLENVKRSVLNSVKWGST